MEHMQPYEAATKFAFVGDPMSWMMKCNMVIDSQENARIEFNLYFHLHNRHYIRQMRKCGGVNCGTVSNALGNGIHPHIKIVSTQTSTTIDSDMASLKTKVPSVPTHKFAQLNP